jgi:regulator of sigma E protease
MRATRIQKADGIVEALGLGMQDTYKSIREVYAHLVSMFSGRISVKNLGGPITIARVAYRVAGVDTWEFFFFLGMISINLAVVNFLPIPLLDGGHMVFLLYESVRGKPASEQIKVGATYVGLAMILSLMAFVIYLDLTR